MVGATSPEISRLCTRRNCVLELDDRQESLGSGFRNGACVVDNLTLLPARRVLASPAPGSIAALSEKVAMFDTRRPVVPDGASCLNRRA